MEISAIHVPHGLYKHLCDVVFGAIQAHQRAYVFITRVEPIEYVVVPNRGAAFNEIAMNSRKYLFVAMYEQNARYQDMLEDAREAYEMVQDALTDAWMAVPPEKPLRITDAFTPAAAVAVAAIVAVVLVVGVFVAVATTFFRNIIGG